MVVNEDSKFFDDEHGQLTRADYENFDITFKDVTEGCKALLNKIFWKKLFKIPWISRQWIRPGQRFDLAK